MKSHYITENGMSIFTNCKPQPGLRKVSKKEHDQNAKIRNQEAEEEQKRIEEEQKPIREREKLIRQRAMENAEKELIDEGVIEARENNKGDTKDVNTISN